MATFVDLKAAYDWVPRWCLLKVFEFRTGASKITKMLAESFTGTKAQITRSKEKFPTAWGLKQGALESPVLFNIYLIFASKLQKRKFDRRLSQGQFRSSSTSRVHVLDQGDNAPDGTATARSRWRKKSTQTTLSGSKPASTSPRQH
eukprot:gene1212-589_t